MSTERINEPTPEFFVFVGENRSPKAQDNGYSWTGCQITGIPRLSMKTLADTLTALELDWRYPTFLNLWNDDGSSNEMNREIIKEMAEDGEIVIGMGDKVQKELKKLGIPHRKIYHPAMRGAGRRSDLYIEHVRSVLINEAEVSFC